MENNKKAGTRAGIVFFFIFLFLLSVSVVNADTEIASVSLTIVDNTGPVITLISPADDLDTLDVNITFIYTADDWSVGVPNCSLYFDNALNQTDTSITESIQQNFTLLNLEVATHNWLIRCYDDYGNYAVSELRSINVGVEPSAPYNATYNQDDLQAIAIDAMGGIGAGLVGWIDIGLLLLILYGIGYLFVKSRFATGSYRETAFSQK